MNRLLSLRQWLTVDETATYMTVSFGENVLRADVLRLALDGHLPLSLRCVSATPAERRFLIRWEDAERVTHPDGTTWLVGISWQDRKHCLAPRQAGNEPRILWLTGTYDLELAGSARLCVEDEYQRLVGGPRVLFESPAVRSNGIIVRGDSTFWVLQQRAEKDSPKVAPDGFQYAERLPPTTALVVKTGAIIHLAKLGSVKGEATEPALPLLDPDGQDYPELLHIALRAWDHARTAQGLGTPKQKIAAFLADRYGSIPSSTREAIALIANWQKNPGRPKNQSD